MESTIAKQKKEKKPRAKPRPEGIAADNKKYPNKCHGKKLAAVFFNARSILNSASFMRIGISNSGITLFNMCEKSRFQYHDKAIFKFLLVQKICIKLNSFGSG